MKIASIGLLICTILILVGCSQAIPNAQGTLAVPTTKPDNTDTPVPTVTQQPTLPVASPTPVPSTGLLCTVQESSLPGWRTCRSTAGFEVSFPAEAQLSSNSNKQARIDLQVTPGTNLSEKYLEITVVDEGEACTSPFAAGYAPGSIPSEEIEINGIKFTREEGEDAGAGNLYQWVAYSTQKNSTCISLGFVLHSNNPGAFSTPPPIFDEGSESAIFAEIVDTLKWN